MERLLPWMRRAGWGYVAVALALAIVAWRVAASGAGQPAEISQPVAQRVEEPTEYLVHVAGAVRKPGVYRIGGDGRVLQAVRLAGGPTAKANLDAVNLAAPVQDGQQIVVPERATAATSVTGRAVTGAGRGGPISLASATVADLDALDGIGPTLAARIVAWRDSHGGFQSVDQLTDVPGIGRTRLEALRPKLTP